MILKKHLRPTLLRTNSRSRGPSELGKYTNFLLETVHDMKLLGSFMDRNEYLPGHKGHVDFIQENFSSYVSGEGAITAHVNTATTISHPIGDVLGKVDLMNQEWSPYGGCSRTTSENGVVLSTTGMLDPSGVQAQRQVEEGQIIYMRVGLRVLSGDVTGFALGSYNISQGEGDLSRYKIPENGSIIYIDKRLYCKHREPVSLNIDVHNIPDVLAPAAVEIVDVQIKYMTENGLTMKPTNTVLKSQINELEDKIHNIINNL